MTFTFTIHDKKMDLLCGALFASCLALLLLLLPSPDLQAPLSPLFGQFLTVFTATAGNPFFLVTTIVLCCLLLTTEVNLKQGLIICTQFGILLLLSFMLKSGLKHITEVPRPYTQELAQLQLVSSAQQFYGLTTEQKEQVITQAEEKFSPWRVQNWHGETNYSLPSGHTIFTAVCVLFWGGFLFRRRKYLAAVLLISWGTGVALSRIWLGMHWPSDVLTSIVCASLLILLVPKIGVSEKS
ncbi:phosphatase PAP2 family protein [Psychromonas ossibalaenae]|uniref:phosphatase PAP2 family protein n=1 Tax=Psychromonas ossibalaenae TaxID=444922 RepID=UPI000363B8EA|nr:phosphatase PAP2 family protein [Psychromonas ossibalaenae]